jgi:hypothetical protein
MFLANITAREQIDLFEGNLVRLQRPVKGHKAVSVFVIYMGFFYGVSGEK